MEILLYAVELVCISVGAGSALIFDTFFALSVKDHKIKTIEEQMLSRINLHTVVSSVCVLLTYILLVIIQLQQAVVDTLGVSLAKVFLCLVALLTSVTLRKIHLPTLLRYQKNYFHLSDSFTEHQDSLVSTAVFSSLSWVLIILLTVFEQQEFTSILHTSMLLWLIVYIGSGLLLSRIAIFFKNKYLA